MTESVVLAISGPTGSGKTSVARHLDPLLRAEAAFIEEPADSLSVPRGGTSHDWSQFERSVVQTKLEQMRRAALDHPRVVFDRSLSEDREVFFGLHHELGHLSRADLDRLTAWFDTSVADRGTDVDAYVYLDVPPGVLVTRALATGQPRWIVDSLERQGELYREWLLNHPKAVTVNAEGLSIPEVSALVRAALFGPEPGG